ncbi:NAD(P)H-hydrate epimerase [Candidatus Magnetomorum sp. HK-1]|nr:NAD(P)H-hydrate epimerase [Candidatus Magnetomorum sp. HK-1]
MKEYLVTAAEMQQMDQQTIESFGLPGIVLMENAGRCAVDYFLTQFKNIYRKKVGVLAGSGNNGGDGFVMARYLQSAGIDVIVYLFTTKENLSGDARANYDRLVLMDARIIEIPDESALNKHLDDMANRNIWIDALLGTGLHSDVRGRYKDIIQWLNQASNPVFSVDIPSGLQADTGKICGVCVLADATITFGHPKIGLLLPTGTKYCGKLAVADIGIPEKITQSISPCHYLLTPNDIALNLSFRPSDMHKGMAGHVLIIGGMPGKTGACAMAAHSAMRIGCGLVTLGIAESLNNILETRLLEVMTLPLPDEKPGILGPTSYEMIQSAAMDKKCIAIGPGMGQDPKTVELVLSLIQNTPAPMVIDADGLNALSGHTDCLSNAKKPLVLTPHPGEMSRLTGLSIQEIQADRLGISQAFATKHKVYLVLKGEKTIIAHPDGMVAINPTGNPGMASGGMGDVLTGVITGVIAQGIPLGSAVETGVFLHGLAADIMSEHLGKVGFIATDIMETLPQALEKCLKLILEKPETSIPSWFCDYVI